MKPPVPLPAGSYTEVVTVNSIVLIKMQNNNLKQTCVFLEMGKYHMLSGEKVLLPKDSICTAVPSTHYLPSFLPTVKDINKQTL